MSFHIDHYTIHIPRGGKFTIGGVTTNKHKLLRLGSKQSNIYHCTVWITTMAKFTIGGETTNKHKLLSLESKQSNIYHCTVWITTMAKFTIGGVTTNKHKLLSLGSKQSNIYHSTVWITIMAKFTNYWLLPCPISYIIPYLLVYYLSDLKLGITRPTMCFRLLLLGCHSVPGVGKFGSMYPVRSEV